MQRVSGPGECAPEPATDNRQSRAFTKDELQRVLRVVFYDVIFVRIPFPFQFIRLPVSSIGIAPGGVVVVGAAAATAEVVFHRAPASLSFHT